MTWKVFLLLITTTSAVVSCAYPVNQRNAVVYHQWGIKAERAGNYALAERNYSRALFNAQLGHSPKEGLAMVMYNLGRVKGYLCKDEEAEKLLKKSVTLEEEAVGEESVLLPARLLELARFYYDHGRYQESLPYYERGLSLIVKLGVEEDDPIALSNVWREYANALGHAGHKQDAETALREATAIEKANPGVKAEFVAIRYDERCSQINPADQADQA